MAPNRRDESLCRVWGTSAVARYSPDLDRGNTFTALCDVIGDPKGRETVKRKGEAMQNGKAITHPAELLSLNCKWKISS